MSSRLEFIRLQEEIGASNRAVSALLGVSESTVEKRRSGKVAIAREVILAMKYIASERKEDGAK